MSYRYPKRVTVRTDHSPGPEGHDSPTQKDPRRHRGKTRAVTMERRDRQAAVDSARNGRHCSTGLSIPRIQN